MAKTLLYPYSLLVPIAGLLSGAVNLRGPVAGYVAGPSPAELRTISGVPGSYLFSDPLPLPPGTTGVHLAPGQEFGLIERGAAGLAILYLSGLDPLGSAPHNPGAEPRGHLARFSLRRKMCIADKA